MGRRGRPKKDSNPFETLDEGWRAEVQGEKDPQKIKDRIMKNAMNTIALKAAQKLDQDLNRIREELKTANAGYKEGFKRNDLETKYMMQCLKDRGIAVPGAEDFAKVARLATDTVELADKAETALGKALTEALKSTATTTQPAGITVQG